MVKDHQCICICLRLLENKLLQACKELSQTPIYQLLWSLWSFCLWSLEQDIKKFLANWESKPFPLHYRLKKAQNHKFWWCQIHLHLSVTNSFESWCLHEWCFFDECNEVHWECLMHITLASFHRQKVTLLLLNYRRNNLDHCSTPCEERYQSHFQCNCTVWQCSDDPSLNGWCILHKLVSSFSYEQAFL